ncbi:hypothetical protein [Hansschlegelia zhihuaiae]|uniref:Uncharacterized protein n=1 Tax=Hansschlegelia zhihuaiae TaxID=405005 RepID=A0A4Q0MHV3_9HYPH|nr:hypothetical protein [Hansschlegelia zhihuaiae]RXF73110.1 hypothetical protein EK403_11510 [Hansschlegelia zhihuaiae]
METTLGAGPIPVPTEPPTGGPQGEEGKEMSRRSGSKGPSQRVLRVGELVRSRGIAAGAALAALLSSSPAAAEVCDKIVEAYPRWLTVLGILVAISVFGGALFRAVWPSVLATVVAGLITYTMLWEVAAQDPIATSAWREGCGQEQAVITAICTLLLMPLAIASKWLFVRRRG